MSSLKIHFYTQKPVLDGHNIQNEIKQLVILNIQAYYGIWVNKRKKKWNKNSLPRSWYIGLPMGVFSDKLNLAISPDPGTNWGARFIIWHFPSPNKSQ